MPELSSPIEEFPRLSDELGIHLLVKRDDLLPFPLAGNKVRKLSAELASMEHGVQVVITNGAVASNHCRTLALMGAKLGVKVQLVLHGDREGVNARQALSLLQATGAELKIVSPGEIASAINDFVVQNQMGGVRHHVIAGGCHTPAGARAYRDSALAVVREVRPDFVFVASGTGATQGGILAGVKQSGVAAKVLGVSVARDRTRGSTAVLEAAKWAGLQSKDSSMVNLLDEYRDGGYGEFGPDTVAAVQQGWSHGLPLDYTYTGKAFAGLLDSIKIGRVAKGRNVLLWHTGGLANFVMPN